MGILTFVLVYLFGWLSESAVIHWTPQKWDKANESCYESDSVLQVIDSLDSFNNLTSEINSTGDVILWIGGKERRKYFIWNNDQSKLVDEPVGCFQTDTKLSDMFVENQPTLCMSYCQHRLHRSYAGLYGNNCVCFNDLHKAVKADDMECFTPCPGDENYVCGSNNTTTIYRSDGSIKWKLFEPGSANKREDCVLITEDNDHQVTWYPDKCGHEHRYICRIYDETICQFKGLISPCYFKSVEKTSWFEAVRKCSNMGGYLAGKDILDDKSVALNGTSLWTSLTRIRQRSIQGRKISELLPRSENRKPTRTGCLALSWNGGRWTIQARSCKEQHAFICESVLPYPAGVPFRPPTGLSKQTKGLLQDILMGMIVAGIAALIGLFFICCYVCRRKERKSINPIPPDNFYYILEKESDYNTITIHLQGVREPVVDKCTETYYDSLAFDGTIQYSEQQRTISGQSDVDYFLYNRTSDLTNEYDVLSFEHSKQSPCDPCNDYHKLSTLKFVKNDKQNHLSKKK